MSSASEPAFTSAQLNYFSPPASGEKPYTRTDEPDPASGLRRRNWDPVTVDVQIENLRGKEDSVTLDTAGFQVRSPLDSIFS
jgi:hypothetical protein